MNTAGTNTGNTTITISYNDVNGTAITHLPPFEQTGSATLLTATTGAAADFTMVGYIFQTDSSATAITISSTISGTVACRIRVVVERIS